MNATGAPSDVGSLHLAEAEDNSSRAPSLLSPEDRAPDGGLSHSLPWYMVLHIYSFACLFFMLAFFAFFSGLNIRSQISSRPFMATVNGFLCATGISRAASLVIEQYSFHPVLPDVASRLLWDAGFPCLLAASVIIQYTFSELSQMSFGPPFLRRRSVLSVVICVHFSTVIITDVITTFETEATVLVYISQSVFVAWCLFIHVTFLYVGYKVARMLHELPSGAFSGGQVDNNTKGIMQLALLARCGNIASSVIATGAQKNTAPPKIHITDENERTVSYHSEAAATPVDPAVEAAPCLQLRGSDLAATSRRPLHPATRRCSESAAFGRQTAAPPQPASARSRSRSYCVPVEDDAGEEISPAPAPPAQPKAEPCYSGVNSLSAGPLRSGLLHGGPRDSIMSTDITLQTVLNHIAYINHPATVKMSPKYQVRRILKVTYATAVLGVLLSVFYLADLLSVRRPRAASWLLLQTAARAAEFLMGCCVANITKQPVQRGGSKLRQYH